jgi:hypothetical protein
LVVIGGKRLSLLPQGFKFPGVIDKRKSQNSRAFAKKRQRARKNIIKCCGRDSCTRRNSKKKQRNETKTYTKSDSHDKQTTNMVII